MPVWDAFSELEALQREMERRASNIWPGQGRAPRVAFLPGRGARQYPLVNLSDDEQNVYVEALAPGVDPKSLDLSVMQGALTIKGEKLGLITGTASSW